MLVDIPIFIARFEVWMHMVTHIKNFPNNKNCALLKGEKYGLMHDVQCYGPKGGNFQNTLHVLT